MRARELTAARKRLGLSQRELGERLGLHRVTVGYYETGYRAIPQVVALAVRCLEYEKKSA